jgi:hypothetical protein
MRLPNPEDVVLKLSSQETFMAWDKIRRETIILESWGTKSTNGTIVPG